MKGIYYGLWVDCIKRMKAQPANKDSWQWKSMFSMSTAMVSNFAFAMTILEAHILGSYFYKIEFTFLSKYWSNVLSFVIIFILPVTIINYLLIFRKQRYKKLLEKYPYRNGMFFMSYFLISLWVPFILLVVGYIFFRDQQNCKTNVLLELDIFVQRGSIEKKHALVTSPDQPPESNNLNKYLHQINRQLH